MREWLLYAPDSALNEATTYYIATVAGAAQQLGWKLRQVGSLRDIPHDADVLVIECKSAFKLRFARPRARTWLWLQGIVPEEARMQLNSPWREALWTVFERITVPRARALLMVSNAMRQHYSDKYGFRDLPAFVMPCVNARFSPEAFSTPGKYSTPRFVYAGSMHKWQCFDLTLDVFKRVRAVMPAATLTVLTAQQTTAQQMVEARALHGVEFDFVPVEQLQRSLATFKYGFVLREPHVVNKVSSPTKLSSYLAAGVIPVMTTAVEDCARALQDLQPLALSPSLDAQDIADGILAIEARTLRPDAVLAAYREAFESYFDHSAYAGPLRDFLLAQGLVNHVA